MNPHETVPAPEENGAEEASGGGIVGISIRNPVFTTMLMIGLMVLGGYSFLGLSIDQYPDVSIPIVSIQTTYPGASPETVEKEVTEKIEEAVNPIQGIDRISSVSLEGVSSITAEFDLGTDVDAATADVRSKIEQIRRELPDEIDPPVVQQFDPDEAAILSLALSSQARSIGELTTLAENEVKDAIEAVDGVGRVEVTGGQQREIHVALKPQEMRALNVSVDQVMSALSQQNLEIPAGRIQQGNREELVRVQGRIDRPEQFERIIIANSGGSPIRLAQVAAVRDTTEEARSVAFVNGERAVGIDVRKVSGANTVDVAEQVKEAVAELGVELGDDVTLSVIRDNSVYIRESVHSVQMELLMGALLTVLVVFLFLNDGRATTITALALPVSVVSTFIMMALLGFTLNILTLMALSLSIGILIDDAIVVIENIVRHRELGKPSLQAALEGTNEIVLAVMAATLTIVAVFVPVAFMGGIIGQFFFEFGITVAWAVLASLFVSFTLTPMLSAWWEGRESTREPKASGLRHTVGRVRDGTVGRFNRWFDHSSERYGDLIGWVLAHRKLTLAAAAASFVAALALFPFIGGAFMPEQDEGEFTVTFETPTGSSLVYTESKAELVTAVLQRIPSVDSTYTSVGGGAQGTVTEGQVFVSLVDAGERPGQPEVMAMVRDSLAGLYGLQIAVLGGGGLGGAAKPIQISLRGPDVEELQRISDRAIAAIATVPGAIEIESSLSGGRPEVRLDVDLDKANDLGLDAGAIAGTLQPLLAGRTATTWEDPSGEEYDVVVRLPEAERATPGQIAALPIQVQDSEGERITVRLGQVASINAGEAPARIDREDLARVATISANLAPGYSVADVSGNIETALAGIDLPDGYAARMGGESEEFAETTGYVIQALLLAIVLIYLILASQFGSFLQPIGIMVSLPLSIVGVMLALLFTDNTLNMMSMIGIILLMGLVTKNAILLVDNANLQREKGLGLYEAAAKAGTVRLRPIMMTTISMIFGMLPIALGLGGEGGDFRSPMAIAVIGGVITSTILTLIVIPVVYTYLEEFSVWSKAKFRGERKAPIASTATTPLAADSHA